jgi:ribosomal protein S18 acetylase RimI-like enzyme
MVARGDSRKSDCVHDERDFALRAATREDRELLYAIYANSRRDEVAHFEWSREQEDAFLRLQFEAQDRGLPGDRQVVLAGGEAVGRLYVERTDTEVCLVDIRLLPGGTGAGLGTAIIESLKGEARAAGLPLTLSVARDNTRAYALYRRLGFEVVGEDAVYLRMTWRPGLDASSVSRRAVVASGVGVAVTAAVATPEPAHAASRRTHQQLLRSSFARSVGQAFAAGTSTIRLRAIADPPYVPSGLTAQQLASWREANFLLTFDLVSGPALPPDLLAVRHRRLGSFPLFLTVTAPGGRRYDALFNREVV